MSPRTDTIDEFIAKAKAEADGTANILMTRRDPSKRNSKNIYLECWTWGGPVRFFYDDEPITHESAGTYLAIYNATREVRNV